MKEPFVDISTVISQTNPLNDMELQSYLSSLTNKRATFTRANVNAAIDRVTRGNEQKFTSAYSFAHSRHLGRMARDIDDSLIEKLQTTEERVDTNGRQYEINEWSNSNKLDTLFFMQILFICITFITVMMFLKVRGIITSVLFMVLSIIAGLVAVFALILRARYTSVVRDSRYWHKARFPSQSNPYPTVVIPATCPTSTS
jgi:hypothetical protein